jgi:hypothetical protein
MKKYWKEDCDKINGWQRLEVKQKWAVEQIAQAKKISGKIDELWDEYAISRVDGLNKTQCTASVWPEPLDLSQGASLVQQEQIKTTLESQSGAFQRLKLLMDSWCAFYFWPLEQSEILPTKDAWLASAELLLGSILWESGVEREMIKLKLGDTFDMEHLYQISQNHLPDTSQLATAVPWYHIGIETGLQQNFHHWELVFTEILGPAFKDQKYAPNGFDLMFGNPPWIKVTWNDAPLLTEFEPLLGVREAKSAKFNSERPKLLENEERKVNYRDRFEQEEGSSMFLNDKTLYPALAGVQTNLYKNFIERSWDLLGIFGKAGLLHPQNTFDDPNGGNFRGQYLNRLKLHLHFKNELLLFKDVDHTRDFCINIYKYQPGKVDFQAIFNIFDPRTIEFSRSHTRKSEIVPSIKDNNGKWEVKGHKQRIINISEKELDLFYRLFEDEKANPSQARIPQIHSLPILKVLSLLADMPKRICNLNNSYIIVEMFHESNAQEKGVITRHEHPSYQAQGTGDWIISGPHFYVANAFNKTAKTECFGKKGADFDKIDLEHIRENYLPKCIYSPGDKKQNLLSFNNSISEWPNISNKPMSKIKRPFFWPINEDQLPAYEIILGEKVNLYGEDISKPGAKTARKFGFFSTWKGSVEDAIAEIKANDNNKSENFHIKFKEIVLTQAKPSKEELKKTPRPITSYPKLAFRAMCRSGAERSLISALTPSGAGAINSARFAIFIDFRDLLTVSTFSVSIIADFFIKIKGRANVQESDFGQLPFVTGNAIDLASNRFLRLSCLTKAYEDFWKQGFISSITNDSYTIQERFNIESEIKWSNLSNHWEKNICIRNDFNRRQALLEIDVLVAIQMGISIDELIQIYSIQFPVMKSYEDADQYDTKGRRLPNTTRKDPGAKELREALKNHDGKSPVEVSWEIDNGNQTVTKTFYPPFQHVDRIEDYKVAYRVFEERLGLNI